MEASRHSTGAAHGAGVKEGAARTLAQTACLVIGATLIAVGVLGFIFAGTSFDTGSNPPGEEFIVFEVNGWHNVVHLATGAFLLFMAGTARTAVLGLLAFGASYLLVTVWGFVDGNDVANLIPINTADNLLHVALTAAALGIAFAAGGLSAAAEKDRRRA